MKRLALASLLVSFVAGTAAGQTAPYDSSSSAANDSPRVILKGSGSSERVVPATAVSYLGGSTGSSTAPSTGSSIGSTGSRMGSTMGSSIGASLMQQENHNGSESSTCDGCGQEWADCCCSSGCGLTIFADWLFLQPRGADTVFAARALNCFDPPLDVEQIDFGGFSNFRVGFAKTLHDSCSEIGATFWMFEANEDDHAPRTTGTDVILPLLLHPSQITCPGSTSTLARASAGIDFDRVNIDYKRYCDWNCLQLDYLVGFGYAKLEQDLRVRFDENSVRADSDMHGYGLRLGGGASKACGWASAFVHADFTLLATNLNARFRSFDVFDGKEVDFSQDLDRLVPVLDLEAGVALNVSCHTTIKLGYIYSIWWNVVTNQSFIEDVQHNDISGGVGDTLTFDGVFARVEFNF